MFKQSTTSRNVFVEMFVKLVGLVTQLL